MKQKFTLVLIIAVCCCLKFNTAKAQVNVQDSLALVDLYDSTNGAHWGAKWNLTMPVSTWYGITVYHGRVTAIRLGLDGLVGSIPSSLSNITNLGALNLSNNSLSGNIPASLGNLLNLNSLNLAINHLTGSIPSSFRNLINLSFLNLAANDLTGNIPSWLGNLINLNYLSLGSNKFSGNILFSIGNLTKVQTLDFGYNNLTGNIPSSLGKLAQLQYLELLGNNLSGNIPSSLGNLANLISLNLTHNQLTDTIPNSLRKLSNLTYLYLDYNEFNGVLPTWLGNLTKLETIWLEYNNFTGSIPSSLNKLKNLYELDLSYNQLSGKIPVLDSLKYLNVPTISNNQFTFAGMEDFAKINGAVYSPQANINIQQNGNVLSVAAGGTISNNTYKWYKNGVLYKTKTGNARITVHGNGNYSVNVTNSVATALTLYSDTINYAGLVNSNAYQLKNENNFSSISVYPNPAKTTATVLFNADGKYTITVTDVSGKILQIKNGIASKEINSIQLDVSNYASGLYFITITDEKNSKQTLTLNKQ